VLGGGKHAAQQRRWAPPALQRCGLEIGLLQNWGQGVGFAFHFYTFARCNAAAFRHLQQALGLRTEHSPLPHGGPHTLQTRSCCPQKSRRRCPPTCSISHARRIKMSRRASASGGGVKRMRQQLVEEDAPALEMAVQPQPLMLLALVKAHFDTLVWLQLCNPQGVALFSFVSPPPRLSRPFAGAPVYDMSLTHAERLKAVGCGFKGRLVRLLSLGVGCHFEPQRNRRACHKMMQFNVRHVAAGLAAAVRDKVAKEAEELCASGQCAAAVVALQRAIDFGDSPSRALKAWLHMYGRVGVAKDHKAAFELAEEGARLGCHHCQGVMAHCYFWGYGCEQDYARSLELARESSGRGSRYGQHVLGTLHACGKFGDEDRAQGIAQAVAFYGLAAAQGLDAAQCQLGIKYSEGNPYVALDEAEALRLYQLAAAQGHPTGLFLVADCHEQGWGVRKSKAAAIRWYKRAQAAGDPTAAYELQRLRA